MLEAETGVALCFDFGVGLLIDFDFTPKPVNVVWHIRSYDRAEERSDGVP